MFYRALMATLVMAMSMRTGEASAVGAGSTNRGAGGVRAVFASADSPSQRRLQLVGRHQRSTACSPIARVGAGGRSFAAVMPGDSFSQDVLIGGLLNFLSIYNILITGRVLLSWVPQLQGVEALRPVYLLTDPYLNAFRRLGLTFGGLDFSVLPAFLLLTVSTNLVASLGAEIPGGMKGRMKFWDPKRGSVLQSPRGRLDSAGTGSAGVSTRGSDGAEGAGASHRRRRFVAFR